MRKSASRKRLLTTGALVAFTLFISCCAGFSQANAPLTPCQLNEQKKHLNRKLVTVRGTYYVEFESSGFVTDCNDPIWVEFGGDVELPTIYCCGRHERQPGQKIKVEGTEIGLRQDDSFKKFFELATATRKISPTGVPCLYYGECHQYHVTATFTGHFFLGKEFRTPNGYFYGGYGHMGCCSLFVVEQVEDVVPVPTGIPIGDDYDCRHDVSEVTHEQLTSIGSSNEGDMAGEEYAVGLIKSAMNRLGDDFEKGEHTTDLPTDKTYQDAKYAWLSHDMLTAYVIAMKRNAELR